MRLKKFDRTKPKYWWENYQKGKADLYGLSYAREIDTAHVYLVAGEPDVWTAIQAGLSAVSFTSGEGRVPAGGVRTLAQSGF
jgi:hypothetical protein